MLSKEQNIKWQHMSKN